MKYHFLFFVLSISTSSIFAQGWNQKKSEGYFQIREKTVLANEVFYKDVKTPINGKIINSVTELYGEYGFTDRITALISLPITSNTVNYDANSPQYANQSDSKFGLGEINVGLAIGLITDKSLVANLYLTAGIPIDKDSTNLGVRLSDNEYTQSIKMGIGYGGFYPLYINGLLGFSNRTKGYSDAINYQLGIGYILNEKWIFSLKVFAQSSLFNGDDETKTSLMFSANNQQYLAYGPEIAYQIKKLGIFANYMAGALPYNVIATSSFSFGAYYKLKKE